ncbi:MAG: polysaccharide deacetylase family protein [Actinomycetia bacterium]|nr:polysaccharide deacetylase family protein [Actinomycetes bacterium]
MSVSVCLSFDFDGISSWSGGARNTRSPNLIARGEFGAVGAERLLDLLRDRQLPSTWFTPGHTIDTWPELCQRIADEGHELGYHGYCHESPSSKRDEADERAILEKGMSCIEGIWGRPPAGSRIAGGNLGARWVDLMLEYGFSYDSSMSPHDVQPTWVRKGDVARTDGPHEFGDPVDLVELPFDLSLDDWPYFSPNQPRQEGLRPPNDVYDIWAAEFDYLNERLGEGVHVLCLHPQCIGRGSRMLMLERLIDHMASADGVSFRTMEDVADGFRKAKTQAALTES